jgi:hypothetical protein
VVFPAGAGPGADYRREVRQPAQTRPFYPGAPLSPPNVSPAGLRFEYGRFWAAYRSWVAGSGAADVFKPEPSVLPPARNVGPGIAAPAAVPYVAPPADRTAAWRSWVAASGAADPWQPSPRTPRGAPNPGPFTFTGGADPTGAPFQPTSFPEAYVSWLLAGGPGDPLRPQPRRLTEPTFAGPAAGFTGGADPTGAVYLPAGVRLPFAAWATLPGGGETFRPAGAVPPGTSVADWLARRRRRSWSRRSSARAWRRGRASTRRRPGWRRRAPRRPGWWARASRGRRSPGRARWRGGSPGRGSAREGATDADRGRRRAVHARFLYSGR